MRFLIISFLLLGHTISEEIDYSFDGNINKQQQFVSNMIQVKEESGERTIVSGGDSHIVIANLCNSILPNVDTQYVTITNPILLILNIGIILQSNKIIKI